jgi:hypothetical protein
MKSGVSATLLVLHFCLSAAGSAQVLYGTLVGNVTDPQQAAVVGAVVKVVNPATGYTAETVTSDRGAYELRNIPPGVYDITITAPGFSTFEAKGISVTANNIGRVDAPLKVGAITEVVTVGAEALRLQTDKSDIHVDLTSRELTEIAIGGYRNFQSLLNLMPGTTPAAFQNASTDTPARALTMNVNGTAGIDRDREHLHQQLRRRAGHVRRRRNQRDHQVGNQPVSRRCLLVSRQSQVGREESVLQSEHARRARHSAAHR